MSTCPRNKLTCKTSNMQDTYLQICTKMLKFASSQSLCKIHMYKYVQICWNLPVANLFKKSDFDMGKCTYYLYMRFNNLYNVQCVRDRLCQHICVSHLTKLHVNILFLRILPRISACQHIVLNIACLMLNTCRS